MQIGLLSWETRHSIAVGGLAEHVTELGAALQRLGHEVHVFTRMGPGQHRYDCVDGVHYHRCPYAGDPDFMADVFRMCDSLVWHVIELETQLGRPFDLIHGHDWLTVAALRELKNRHGRRVVMTIHSTEYGRCGNQLWDGRPREIRDMEWEGTYLAERVICVSKALKQEVEWLYSVPADKVFAVYNGIDLHRFSLKVDRRFVRRRYGLPQDQPMVLFAGRMTRQKGPDLLVDSMPGVIRHHPDTHFVFAGDGDLRTGLVERSAALGLATRRRFVGHCTGRELVELFKAADLVCVPSRNEPFGIVILEAWGARKPVVASRNGGPGEFITHQKTGLTVSGDSEAIGRGICDVLADQQGGRRMGRAGRREAEAHFSWNTVASATERVYFSALGL